MTPQEREMVLALVAAPGGGATVSREDVLLQLGASDGAELGARLLREAIARRDAIDVEMGLIVTYVFGTSLDHLEPLIVLATADWHFKHEDVVTLLGRLSNVEAVPALSVTARWVPGYLDYDDSRSLAVKSVRALGAIQGPAAELALVELEASESESVRRQVSKQLERRKSV